MNLLLLTPALEGSLAGNRATAERWASLLESAGHRVTVDTGYDEQQAADADLLIALHAWRSHDAIIRWRHTPPFKPVILALTGTDLYRYQFSHPRETLASLEQADRLVVLHRLAHLDIPARFRNKVSVVLQSAPAMEPDTARTGQRDGQFTVCVIGHLREEKDPLRTAKAARLLPASSRLRVIQAGRAHDTTWECAAQEEAADNPRYHWLGQVSRAATRELMASSQVMVISSVMEGGANVVSEACRAGLPVLASNIPGNTGLLGEQYPGLFPAGDEQALAKLLQRAENDVRWLDELRALAEDLARDFTPQKELAALEGAIQMATGLSPEG